MTLFRRAGTVAGIAVALAAGTAAAQTWPSQPLKLIVPYAPGAMDQETRAMQALLERQLGQPVQVETREGGGSSVGTNAVARGPADGHQMLYVNSIVLTVGTKLRKVPYALTDFKPVAQTTASAHLMAARAGLPYKTAAELVAYAKANPGKVAFGSPGTGTGVHMANEYFAEKTGIDVNHIPFNGLNQAVAATLGGNIDYIVGFPIAIMPQVEAGKMVALAQFSSERSPLLPNVPTLKEQGIDVVIDIHTGVFAPKGTPDAVVKKMDEALKVAVNSPEFAQFGRDRWTVPYYRSADAFGKAIEVELTMYDNVLNKLGIKP